MKTFVPVHLRSDYHPLKYLGDLPATDARKTITAVAAMPYPADILVEPEFEGLTYFQVAVIKQAQRAARYGDLDSLTFISDRIMGKPAQVNLNVSTKETYEEFLQKIIDTEAKEVPHEEFVLE